MQAANVGVGAVGGLELQGGIPQFKDCFPFFSARPTAWFNLLPTPGACLKLLEGDFSSVINIVGDGAGYLRCCGRYFRWRDTCGHGG